MILDVGRQYHRMYNNQWNALPDIANMKIGTPPKTFRLLVDSGSADLWVGATGCRSDAGGGCVRTSHHSRPVQIWKKVLQGNHTFLGQNSSNSYVQSKDDWAIGYASGSVWGYIVHGDISIAGLTLKNLTFGVAFNESANFTGYLITSMPRPKKPLMNALQQ